MMNSGIAQLNWPDLPLGIGTSRLCSLNGGLPVRQAARLLSAAADLGVGFVDTAPTYGQGHAELAIGELATGVRDRFFICSKVGYSFGRAAQLINAAKPLLRPLLPWASSLRRMIASARDGVGRDSNIRLAIEPETIRSVLEGTLRRIRRDHLDLLLLHDPSRESVEREANQEELHRLAKAGLIRAWGVSTGDPAVIDSALGAAGCSVVQFPVYHDWIRENPDVVAKCAARGVPIIANSVFTGLSQRQEGVAPGGRSTVQDCLAYALGQRGVCAVLSGTRNRAHLQQNVELVRSLSLRLCGNVSEHGAALASGTTTTTASGP